MVDKPGGMTSHDVVGRTRRLLQTRRVGHAGTLDPMATGVLLLGVGLATRLLGRLTLTDKAYDATVRLGASTVTDDAEGEVLETRDTAAVSDADIESALARFRGRIEQRPSAVSAIKIAGERAYKRVRAGESVDLPARPVEVSALVVNAVRRDGGYVDVDVHVECSTGTYVRAIARDVGAVLEVGGHLTRLRRTRVGPYPVSEACLLDDVTPAHLEPVGDVAARCFATLTLEQDAATDVGFGRPLRLDLGSREQVALFDESGRFLAIYEQHGPVAKAVAVFTG